MSSMHPTMSAKPLHRMGEDDIRFEESGFGETPLLSLIQGTCEANAGKRSLYCGQVASTHPPLGDVFSNVPDSLGLGNYEVVVEDVVRQLLDLHLFEARVFEHLFRLLLAPHRAQALTALRQGDGHAVHSGDGVEERSDGVVEVIVDVAGARDVLHQVDPVIFKGVGYTLKPRPWLCLVVDRIEGGDQVV